ncbi:MAG: Na/Pi cotransporter family protein [Candidatus Dadabacteria bacterium]|nr:MAG: Na/Pi cotransporter family protein [Candidatus Dadabacteria bacterium]
MSGIDVLSLITGLGLFLFGLERLEFGLDHFAGDRMRRLLERYTDSYWQGLALGTVVTALLQSSSVVSLIVLAFVGAGLMGLRNALGVIIGANIGTTMTGWIVAVFGFRVDVGAGALQIAGMGGLLVFFLSRSRRAQALGMACVGFGLLFTGLEAMKTATDGLAGQVDWLGLREAPLLVWVAVALVVTAVVQSSSAVIAIMLSLLNANLISIEQGAAIVIGADVGTSVTAVLGAIGENAVKKQVAAAHVLFNLAINVFAYLALTPLLWLIQHVGGIQDPLLLTVAFHSSFNLAGAFLIVPVLGPFVRWLTRMFPVPKTPGLVDDLLQVPVQEAVAAVSTVATGAERILNGVLDAARTVLLGGTHARFLHQYERLKQAEGDLAAYALRIHADELDEQRAATLQAAIRAARLAVGGAKAVKDILADFSLQNARNLTARNLFGAIRSTFAEQVDQVAALLSDTECSFSLLSDVRSRLRSIHDRFNQQIYGCSRENALSGAETATLLNVVHELTALADAGIRATGFLRLPLEQAEDLENIPITPVPEGIATES